MKYRQRSTHLILLTAVLLVVSLLLTVGCYYLLPFDHLLPLEFENRTDQVLTIYVENTRIDDVKPDETIERETIPAVYPDYLIEARDATGELVYSKMFTKREISNAEYKIVIPPSLE